MNNAAARLGRGLAAAACALTLVVPAAQAGGLEGFPFQGRGHVLAFDAAGGSGAWVGEIRWAVGAGVPELASFAVLATFDFDATVNRLRGRFEFAQADDLASTLSGRVTGGFTDAAGSLTGGGQWELHYRVLGSSGRYAGYRGYALSLLEFDPSSTGDNNYREQGLLVAVPEPGSAALLTAGLLLLLAQARRPLRGQGPARRSGRARLP